MGGGLFGGFFSFLFLAVLIVVYIFVFVIIKPFRFHKTRPATTFLLKFTYLVYVLAFFVCFYMLLFSENPLFYLKEQSLSTFGLFLLVFSFIVPNLGYFFRRAVKNNRYIYNLAFSGLNVVTSLFLVVVIYQILNSVVQ
jgi:hypothetical protein